MKPASILFSLCAAVSAIDAIMYIDDPHCTGRWIGCLNLNPDTCCSLETRFHGLCACYSAIPREWNIAGRAYDGFNCPGNPRYNVLIPGSKTSRDCIPSEFLLSVGYGFYNPKVRRGVERMKVGEREVQGGSSRCTSFQKADAIGLADGTVYSLKGMNETAVEELFGYLEKGGDGNVLEGFREYVVQS